MSKAEHSRVRFMLTLLIVAMMIPWNLSNASADDATPPDPPTQENPTATTQAPTATDVPAEPTATDAPVEPTSTVPPTAVPTETSVPLPTETPEPEFSSSALFTQVSAEFLLCADDSRIGEVDMQYYGGSFSGAGTVGQCRATEGVTITLTDVAGVYGPSSFVIPAGQESTQLYNQIQEGTYSVSYSPTGASTFPAGSFADQVVMYVNDVLEANFSITVQLFVESEPEPDPVPDGTGSLFVDFASCRDVERGEETDFLITGFAATSNVDQCEVAPFEGQVTFTLEGTSSGGSPYGPVTSSSNSFGGAQFQNVPFGSYTLTESIYGNKSEPFTVGGANGDAPRILVQNYFANEPEYDASLLVSLRACEDDERDGQVDYLLVKTSDLFGQSSCVLNSAINPTLDVTVFDSEGNNVGTVSDFTGNYKVIPGLKPGAYSVQLEGYPVSQSFELISGDQNYLDIIVYNSFDIDPEPPGTGGNAYLSGQVAYCTSDELDGQVQYVIEADFNTAATGDCVAGPDNGGVVFVHRYANTADTEPAETWTFPVIASQFFSETIGSLPAGYYRIGFSPSSFTDPIELSDEFIMYDGGGAHIIVYFFGAQIETSVLQIRKDICYSDEKADTTDFFFQQEELGFLYATDETTNCRVATTADGQYTFTLTDVESEETVSSVSYVFPVALAYLSAIPAGTYTLTEQNGLFSRTSEPFEFDPGAGDYSVLVRNYLAGEIPPNEGELTDGAVLLWAYDCVSDAKAGTSEFYFNPGIVGSNPQPPQPQGGFAASSVENCVAAEQYSFELDNGETVGDTSAAASYPMIQGPFAQGYVYASSMDGIAPSPMPAGSYVIREITTGSVSEPIDINLPLSVAAFYRYAAAPTPTPSPTTTPEPTATATGTPDSPAELVANDVTLEVAASQTITGNLNEYFTGGVPPYTFAPGTMPTQGTLTVNPDGTFTYIANIDASGTDSFTYSVTDGQVDGEVAASATDSGLVTIVIAAPGETPIASPTAGDGTVEPGDPDDDATATADASDDATATAATGDPSGGGINTLPSTGQGQAQSWNGLLQVLLLTGLALILLAAGIRQNGRRS